MLVKRDNCERCVSSKSNEGSCPSCGTISYSHKNGDCSANNNICTTSYDFSSKISVDGLIIDASKID